MSALITPVSTVDQLKAYMRDRYGVSGAVTLWMLDGFAKKPGFVRLTQTDRQAQIMTTTHGWLR
jgi:hypothetical protein